MKYRSPVSDSPAPSRRRAAVNRLAAGVLGVVLTTIIGTAGVIAVYYPLRDAQPAVQWLLVLVMMTFESAAVHLPSEVILPVGGWQLVRDGNLGVPGVIGLSAVAAAGNTCGSFGLYCVGRLGGRPVVRRFGRYFLVHEHDLDRAEEALRNRRAWALLLTRVIPVVRTYAGLAAGALRMPVPTFLVMTFAGSLLWCLPFVTLGAVVGEHWDVIEGPAKVVGLLVVATLFVGLAFISVRLLRAEEGAVP
jgi:membrane protein DedA with SNARE-associated domain